MTDHTCGECDWWGHIKRSGGWRMTGCTKTTSGYYGKWRSEPTPACPHFKPKED